MKLGFTRVDRQIFFAGALGLGAALFAACGEAEDASTSSNAGAPSSAGNDSAAGAPSSMAGAPATAACAIDPATAENTAAVVAAAKHLLDVLSPDEQAQIGYDLTLANAQQWSNLPTTFVARNGLRIGDMSNEAQTAALALVAVAAGETGATLLNELREADEFLVSDGKAASTDYGRGLYYFSIHGAPSTDSPWLLQIAGHHLAYNFTYSGLCTSATPLFDGVEPTSWTDASGIGHAPLEAQRAAVVALLSSIQSVDGAKLSGTYADLINGPGGGMSGPGGRGGDVKYPSGLTYPTGVSGRGVAVSTLSTAQVALVKSAIAAWVDNVANPVAGALLAEYESDDALAKTYIGYSGSPDLTTQTSYFRVDGPRVWIELTVQGGIVYRDRVHYHTIWRDKVADYGAEFASS